MKTFGIILLIMLVIFGLGAKAFLDHASPEHEHSYGEWTTKTPATCTEAGVEVRVCECNDEETREIPATGHTYGEWETKTPANCTDAEVEARKCACGAEETREGDAASGHNFTEQVATEEYLATANCGAKATYYVSCACGAKGEDTFEHGDILPHDYYVAEVFMPSCTEGGYSTYKCRTCDDSYVGDETDAAGHSYDADVTEPTCTAGGYTTYTCACGDSYVADETDATAHNYDAVVTEPTCTAGGYTTYTCACGDSYVADETDKLDHNMVAVNDDTHHWTACSNNCGEATEKVAHSASAISASYNGDAMQHVVAEAKDFTVTGTCACGKEFDVTEDIEVVNGTLALGENTVTVKVGDASADVIINATEFYKAVSGTIVADTHINSGNNGTSYGDRTELYIYNTGMYRVFFKFNFTDALNSKYYAEFGDEAIVQFTFTVTNGVDLTGLPITFKSYLTSEVRSNADFSQLTWGNYSETYTLGWGTEEDPNNTVSLLAKETVGDRAIYADGKLVITVTLRELEGCIDENGNAIFVLLTAQKDVKPYVASMENTEFDIPAVKVIYSENHAHAYIEQVVDEKYLASANCEEQAKYYVSCSCGEAGTVTFAHGEVIEHSFGEWETKTPANCLDAEVEIRTCHCGAEETRTGDAALNHNMETKFDETNHWTECSRCDEATEPVPHFGGEATETEQATCEGCGQKYGGLASHVHQFGDWQTRTEATCTDAEVEFRKCTCGAEETQTGDAALNHNMKTEFDADKHWTECSRCDEATDPVAHFGGEATETEQAVCEGCGQSYGELKPAEKKEYTINGTVKDDTFVYSSWTNTDLSEREYLRVYNSDSRTYFRYNFSDILGNADFVADKENAVVTFTFYFMTESFDYVNSSGQNKTMTVATPTDSSTVIFRGFNTNTSSIDTDFSSITWTSVNTGNEYNDIHYASGADIVNSTMNTENAKYENNVLTITVKYSDIEQYINSETGDALFVITTKTKSAFVYSIESEYKPTVSVTYTK